MPSSFHWLRSGVRSAPGPTTSSRGDVGYVPQGYGHYIENTGSDDVEMVIVFNNATYESISITAWMAGNPALLLATNFGAPESVFAKFPKGAVVLPEQS
jgi:oxalate decarboxylase